ncbi:MAG TPA: GAF domain-containing sensor histidine kinase [Candidatus Bathyarchaeia archaeon]|nr:GAF domain-containing sensor histidine kinase [Candidatus Bathyarchaeia archaeon]
MENFITFTLGTIIIISVFVIIQYKRQLDELKGSFRKLSQSFEELDEQAKLIVKTDLELNKAQEELDKRLEGLDALQKLSRAINTTLDENEIFNRLSKTLLNELGFEKYLFLTFEKNTLLKIKRHFGFYQEECDKLNTFLKAHRDIVEQFQKGETLASLKIPEDLKRPLGQILRTDDFIIAPILVQNTLLGLTVAGNHSPTYFLTEGDSEIVSILADQLGQAIENARLFEQVYTSRQELELNIQDRTKQLTDALERVKRINKMKSDFISAVSHELRTPLTSIKGYAAILISGKIGELPGTVKERLEKINKHSDNLVSLVNNLLDISRIESGKAELKFKYQSIVPVVEIIEDLLMPQFKEKNITFQKRLPLPMPKVYIDPSQLERVFINLLSNALKFTPTNGVITVATGVEDKNLLVSVSDTGIGIKQDDADKLFDEFYRVDNDINQTVKGTGLGLSLAKRIIEAHHGSIWVKSKFGEGTTFFFTLPTDDLSETKNEPKAATHG